MAQHIGAGKMDQRITLQTLVSVSDGAGGKTTTWQNYAADPVVWTSVIAKSGAEGMVEGRTTATFVVLFTIYNRSDINPRDRIIWQSEYYNIRGVRNSGERDLRLVIEAERGVTQ